MHIRQMTGLAALMLAVSLVVSVAAQTPGAVPEVRLPASPRGLSAIQVGESWVTIDYGRPILRGRRNIFQSGADYGATVKDGTPVWRAGANDSTRLTTQRALTFGDTTIQPGVYNVLVDLQEGAWTLVLSTQPVQPRYDPNERVLLYGSYNYDPAFDVLRVPMRLSTSSDRVEQFTIDFVNVGSEQATIVMSWETTVASVDFRF